MCKFCGIPVVWSGKNDLRLHFDSLIVNDNKAKKLYDQPEVQSAIENLTENKDSLGLTIFDESLVNFNNVVAGWYGSDEPKAIDQCEPIQYVNQLLRVKSQGRQPLFISEPMSWNARIGNSNKGMHPLYSMKEFYYRSKPDGFIMQTHLYHYPYRPATPENIKLNINNYAENLKVLSDIWKNNPYFSFFVLVQGGKWLSADLEVHPDKAQLNYSIYMALLYGAKGIFLDQLFTRTYPIGQINVTGIIDPGFDPRDTIVSDNGLYWEIRDKISPQLKGMFGKKLKLLLPLNQYTDIRFDTVYNWINSIRFKYECDGNNGGNSIGKTQLGYDLGFFEQSNQPNVKYFMLLRRWYQDEFDCPLAINYNLGSTYINWKLTNYIDSSKVTKLSQDVIHCRINAGDGILFSLAPVIESGGFLIDNETISGTNTLEDTLIVKDGAKLTVNGTYYVNAPVTVERGAELYLTPGSGMVFSENGSLFVNGILTANGMSDSLITFEFTNSNNGNGIIARDYTSLSLQYCVIKNADAGLQIINSPSSTTKIRYNRFEQCNTAVSAVNTSSLLIQGNTIYNCRMGIFTSQSVNLNIVQNSITSLSYAMPGMFLNSSSGNIRSNVISGHSAGINLANSSPLLGMNSIFNNYDCGVYSGFGSVPDLRLKVSSDVCENPSYYYPLGGVNHIYENGGMINEPYYQGAEIFISYADILLQNGINSIIDDRKADNPPYLTGCLFNGQTNDFVIQANGNFWGENPEYPLSERFCSLDVIYEPENDGKLPDYRECEIIMFTTDGIAIDTLYPAAEAELTGDIEQLFAQAEQEISEGDYTEAEGIYQLIINNYSDLRTSFPAFARLMMIERITNGDTTAYNNLKNFYLSHLNTISDTLLQKMVRQLANICLVYGGAFQDAVAVYEDIIQQNPGSEKPCMLRLISTPLIC
jgi:hypothetical protein